MLPHDIDRILKEGIDAVKRGEPEEAQKFLLQVIDHDENNEQGWLWISYVVEDPNDKIVALENVLTINPNNNVAKQNLDRWRKQVEDAQTKTVMPPAEAVTAAAPAASATTADENFIKNYAAYSPVENVEAIDNIYQCIYCGAPAEQQTRKCPECGRELITRRKMSNRVSDMLRTTIYVAIAQFAFAAIESFLIASLAFQGQNSILRYVFDGVHLEFYIGDYINWMNTWAQALLWISGIRVAVILMIIAGLTAQLTIAYYAAIAFLGLDIMWSAVRWVFKFLGPIAAIIDVIVDITGLAFLSASDRDFAINEQRLLCQADPRLKGGAEFNRRARIARMEGKWALAVAYWRAAIAAMPMRPEFYKSLSIGYAQIGYYKRALTALAEAGRQSPIDDEIPHLKQLIEDKQKGDLKPRG